MITSYSLRPSLHHIFSKSLVVVALTAISLLCGTLPNPGGYSLSPIFTAAAYAQSINEGVVRNYAMASLKIERLRQEVYAELKRITGGDVPNISSCGQSGLPENVRRVWDRFCSQSEKIIEDHGFSNSSYNAITTRRQSDASLNRRIQQQVNELVRQGF